MAKSISPVITTASSSPVLIASSSLQQRAHSSSPTAIPLSSTIPLNVIEQRSRNTISPIVSKKNVLNNLPINSNGILTTTSTLPITSSAHNQISINISDGISPAILNAAMPINLNMKNDFSPNQLNGGKMISTNGLQIINTGNNGVRQQMIELNEQNGSILSISGNIPKDQIKMESMTSKIDSEPPAKVIKLINGNTIALATVDKDNKLIPSNQLTLSQMVVSQIPLIASTQSLRVIGQAPNGLPLELPSGNNNKNDKYIFNIHSFIILCSS